MPYKLFGALAWISNSMLRVVGSISGTCIRMKNSKISPHVGYDIFIYVKCPI